jgi:Flp pilus assembly protein TadG
MERKRRVEKGSTMVESVLVLLTIVGMIIFIMDMGRLLLVQQFISERARTTVRAASVNNWTATQVANYLCYNSINAPSGGTSTTPGYMGLTPSQVTYTLLGTAGTLDYRLQVKVSGVPMFTWIPFITGQYTAAPVTVTFPAQSLGATT